MPRHIEALESVIALASPPTAPSSCWHEQQANEHT
jgi:hypothetical protein